MNGKTCKLLRKFSKLTIQRYGKVKAKFRSLNRFDKTEIIKEVKSLLNNGKDKS